MSNPATNASPRGPASLRPTGGGVKISSSARGILRSSSLGHSNLSLQQVIHRIVGQQQPSVQPSSGAETPSALRTTRSRSFSMSDMATNKPSYEENVDSPKAKSP